MNVRLGRIEGLIVSLTTLMVLVCFASDAATPLGVVFGGMAAWLDFVVIRGLAALLVTHKPARTHIVPLALAKSFALVSVPAVAVFAPGSLVSGPSFAIGVTTLPIAILFDACLPLPVGKTGEV